jgi:hypothetical protein
MVQTAQSSVRNWRLLNAMAYRRTYKATVEDSDTSVLLKLRNTSVEKTVEKLFADLRQTTHHSAKKEGAERIVSVAIRGKR